MNSFFKFLSRNKLYTIIELFGLSFSLCFLILIFNFTDGELQRASSQPQSKNIYVAGMRDYIGMTYGTPDYLSSKIPEITEWCRWIPDLDIDCKIGDEWRMSEAAAADPNFFDFFDFDFEGTSKDKAFESISSAVVSRSFAASAFEGESPVGKSLYMELSGVAQDVVITGVIEDFTDTFLKPVDIIINAKNKLCSSFIPPMDHFGVVAPFFKVVSGTDIKELNDKMEAAYKEYWDYWGDGFVGPSKIYRMDEIYFSDSASSNFLHGDKGMLRILLAVCMVLLISAIMNYINMTSAQASKRAKEMATHRLLGASKETVIGKYISESIVFTAVSFAVGLLFAAALKTPVQKALSSDVAVNLSLFPDVRTVAAYIAIIVVVGILSGLIPAFLVSRFKPIDVVKGEFRVKSKMVFSKVFISAQAFLAIVLCSLSISMFAQLKHLSNIPMGYNTTNLLEVNTFSMGEEYTLGLKQEIETLPMVSRVGLSKGMPYRVGAQIMPDKNGNDVAVRMLSLDSTAFNMFGFKMKEHYTKMNSPVVYYTEYAANTLGITENNPSPNAQVFPASGIMENFHTGMKTAFEEPFAVVISNTPRYKELLVETLGGHSEALNAIRSVVRDYSNEVTGKLRDDVLQMQYCDAILDGSLSSTRNTVYLTIVFMILSVCLSALGMFAMSLYFCSMLSKSIAVRKVYGAEVSTVTGGILKQFVVMTGIAAVLSLPLSIGFIRRFLQGFGNHITFPYWAIIASVALILAVTLFSTYFCANRAARRNPVDSLKME